MADMNRNRDIAQVYIVIEYTNGRKQGYQVPLNLDDPQRNGFIIESEVEYLMADNRPVRAICTETTFTITTEMPYMVFMADYFQKPDSNQIEAKVE